ncbi:MULTISPECIES: tripartite tricarboxylate transporter substrate binding protein [unclassified Polaromonas]|uniref:Bug family tripartite tricarboxylate transporter substrate binding protein n=1 Tax=unclassified Polaromonas TaxID=2638319 RepID=UPI000F092ECB|nr:MULTISPECIES: tripartite tricarboxylate transporter substrate binding protein [unclassified Polaromonas]AYQ29705.1 tripartite tricarboxylate transporter substrate binding protein [Polaromonas sp. SP1]QGJ19180.1 tripartite tricarboxylate transporter substrate binding protein [Polaromonas sp. Pch-P]
MQRLPVFLRRTLGLLAFAAATASAQTYPARPIEWVVPYPAGGGSDVVARALTETMGKALGQPLVINNKPGAATNIGAEYVARAKADGYTLLTGDTATLAANPALYSKLGYSAEKDLAPIGLLARFPMILVVHPAVPAKNLAEFMAWAKTQKAGVSYATPGAGSPHHLATELFRGKTGLPLVHVPYRGAAPAVQDVAGGQLPFMFVDTASGMAFINAGRLRAIGIASPQRVKNFETIPTLDEQGLKGFEAYAWQGLAAPAGTPADVVAKLNKSLVEALNSTPVKARFQVLGLEPTPSTPAQMASYAKAEREKWAQVIKDSGIKLD